jgi:Arc/MetJ-type ribon-helix-helix transcriptional regulator
VITDDKLREWRELADRLRRQVYSGGDDDVVREAVPALLDANAELTREVAELRAAMGDQSRFAYREGSAVGEHIADLQRRLDAAQAALRSCDPFVADKEGWRCLVCGSCWTKDCGRDSHGDDCAWSLARFGESRAPASMRSKVHPPVVDP